MSSQHHIIGRTLLEINTGRLADVLSLQEEVSLVFQRQALPAMEGLFDQLVDAEEVVRLDRMVVDVGTVSPQLFADEFVRQLLEGLNQVLGDRLAGHLSINTDIEIITQDRAGADWEVLLFFLQYGRMPWWVSVGDWQDWLTRWEIVVGEGTAWRSPLHKLLATQRGSQQRLINQFPEDFRHQLVLQLQPAWTLWPTLLNQARQLLQALALPSERFQQLERQAWLLLLSEIGLSPAPARPLPTATWVSNWLAQLVEIGQLAVSPNSELSLGTFEPNPAEPFSSEIDRTSEAKPSD